MQDCATGPSDYLSPKINVMLGSKFYNKLGTGRVNYVSMVTWQGVLARGSHRLEYLHVLSPPLSDSLKITAEKKHIIKFEITLTIL